MAIKLEVVWYVTAHKTAAMRRLLSFNFSLWSENYSGNIVAV